MDQTTGVIIDDLLASIIVISLLTGTIGIVNRNILTHGRNERVFREEIQ